MSDGIFSSFKVSAMGLRAQRLRLDVAAENLANAETTRTPAGGPYHPKTVVFSARQERPQRPLLSFGDLLAKAEGLPPAPTALPSPVLEAKVVEIAEPVTSEYAPDHPDADEQGILLRPNVDPVDQMLTLIKATRAYEANATAMDAAKDMIARAIDL